MSAPPYMRLYWADYFHGTRHLRGPAEHGAYLMLIAALWDNGGRLPADDAALARHAFCSPAEWATLAPTILPFFKVVRGHLTHKRVTEELAKYADTVRKRKAAGKSGGDARARNNTENGLANAKQKPTKPELEPELVEEDANASSPAAAAPTAKAKARRKPEATIPEGFPDAEALDDARSRAAAEGRGLDVARQAERFRNHAQQNDRRCRDWRAAWRNWTIGALEDAPVLSSPARPVVAAAFAGPADLRARIVERMGDAWTASYLDPCRWADVPIRTLNPANAYAAGMLGKKVGDILRSEGVHLAEPARGAAA